MKILLVDDSKTILKLSSKLLSSVVPDCEIVTFDTPMNALEFFRANSGQKLDFALLDYNMESMNGVELAEALFQLTPSPLSPSQTSIVSANIQEAVIQKASALGISYIPKPLDQSKLKDFLSAKGIILG